MTAPITTKVWTVLPNKRNAYTSLADMTAWCLFENKVAMKNIGWTVKFSCDGTTGPSSGADTTDRWATRANAQTRGAAAANPQSWIVMQNADGVQVLLAFQGATDDAARISISPKGLYTLATPSTNQPTATDELATGATVIGTSTSGDRTMTIWVSNDTKNWSFIVFRAGAVIGTWGAERITNFCAPNVFSPDGLSDIPYVTYRYTSLGRQTGAGVPGTITPTSLLLFGVNGALARVFTAGTAKSIRVGGGQVMFCYEGNVGGVPSAPFASQADVSGLNNGTPAMPIIWSSSFTSGATGFIGSPIDWWQMVTTSASIPNQGDFVPGYEVGDTPGVSPQRTNWFVALGCGMVRPWKNAAVTLETT